jgi:putative oxidoreductase
MKRYNDLGLLLLRAVFSLLMLTHGFPKLMRFVEGDFVLVGDPIGLGGVVSSILVLAGEVVAPVLILIGLQSRAAAVISAFTMAVAAFVVHGHDPIAKKELALLYMFAFIAVALMGPGSFSIDKK